MSEQPRWVTMFFPRLRWPACNLKTYWDRPVGRCKAGVILSPAFRKPCARRLKKPEHTRSPLRMLSRRDRWSAGRWECTSDTTARDTRQQKTAKHLCPKYPCPKYARLKTSWVSLVGRGAVASCWVRRSLPERRNLGGTYLRSLRASSLR